MAMLPSQFRSDDHDDMNTFKAYDSGRYNFQIVESEMKLTKEAQKAKDEGVEGWEQIGQMLNVKIEFMEGKYKGQFIFKNFNLINKNPKAVEIANKEFATLCRAVGVAAPEDSSELHKIPFEGELIQKGQETDKYGIQNEFKMFREYSGPIDDSAPEQAGSSASSAGKGGKRNW